MRRLVTPLLALTLLLAGCSTTAAGAPTPDCDLTNGSSVLLMAQAVPTAELIPCVDEVPPGWSVSEVSVQQGAGSFQFDSDDLGDAFLEVRLGDSCPARTGEEHLTIPGAIASVARVVEAGRAAPPSVAVVPEDGDNVVTANAIVVDLTKAGVAAAIVPVGRSVEDRIGIARARLEPALVVDDLSNAEGMVVLVDPDSGQRTTHEAEELIDSLAGLVAHRGPASYRGGWYYRFAGGCVTYEFDAEGPGSAAIPNLVTRAVSFVARPTLDRFTQANVGLRLDP